ncbi:MAG: hypothetical protein K2N80_12940 [Lachnospiraceae bacterium]|nr:hypothetical protein [Lachnospiraceae bacterium]
MYDLIDRHSEIITLVRQNRKIIYPILKGSKICRNFSKNDMIKENGE